MILHDDIIAHSLDILRLNAGTRKEMLQKLQGLKKRLMRELRKDTLTDLRKSELNKLLKDTIEAISKTYSSISNSVISTVTSVAGITAAATSKSIAELFKEGVKSKVIDSIATPTKKQLNELVRTTLVEGSPQKAWWAKQEKDFTFKFKGIVQRGVTNGLTNGQITKEVAKELDIAYRNAASLVHTSIQTVSNNARLKTFEENPDMIKALEWVATLDGHVCFAAGSLVSMSNGNKIPIEQVKPGDYVIGGVTKKPRKIVACSKSRQSTVVIHSQDGYNIKCTPDHLFMTTKGWVKANELKNKRVCTYVPERQTVCGVFEGFKAKVLGTLCGLFIKPTKWWEESCFMCYQEVWAGNSPYGCIISSPDQGGSSLGRSESNSKTENKISKRVQHDSRWGWHSWFTRSYLREEKCSLESIELNITHEREQGKKFSSHESTVARSEISGDGEYCERGETSRTKKRSGMGCEEKRSIIKSNERKMARSGIPGKDRSMAHKSGRKSIRIERWEGEEGTKATRGSQETKLKPSQEMARSRVQRNDVEGSTKITSIEKADVTTVYDIQVETDESFICEGMVVHNCKMCIPRDGKEWTNVGKKPIGGHGMVFLNPPIHFNDRCVLNPVTFTFKELGIDLPEPPTGKRAVAGQGPISAKQDFDDFLSRKGVKFQNEVLGPGRADLWRRGVITLRDLVDGAGNELTIKQIKAKH